MFKKSLRMLAPSRRSDCKWCKMFTFPCPMHHGDRNSCHR